MKISIIALVLVALFLVTKPVNAAETLADNTITEVGTIFKGCVRKSVKPARVFSCLLKKYSIVAIREFAEAWAINWLLNLIVSKEAELNSDNE